MLEYLSVTRLKSYACPWRFQQLYVRKQKEPGSDAATLGSYVHRLIAEQIAGEHGLPGPEPHPRDVPLVPEPDIAQEAEDIAASFSDCDPLAGMRPLAVEAACEGLLDNLVPFQGRVDCVCEWHGSLVVWDWKSGWQMPQSLGNEAQLATYAWLVAERWPDLAGDGPVYIRQYYLRYGRWLEAQISRMGRANARYTLTRLAEGVETAMQQPERAWPAFPCQQCAYCQLVCPLSLEAIRPPQTAQGARKLAGRLVALEAQVRAANEALRAWCDEHGPVSAAGREYSYSPTKNRTLKQSPQELIDLLGEDAWKLLKVTVPRGTPPKGVDVVEEVGGTRFGSRAAKGGDDVATVSRELSAQGR